MSRTQGVARFEAELRTPPIMTTNALIAPLEGSATEPELASPPAVTEQEIGEYREQDRVLPVSSSVSGFRPFLATPRYEITGPSLVH
jgi:hypothetical protein